MKRRNFLKLGAAGSALSLVGCESTIPETDWYAGSVVHILPLVSESAFNIKISLERPVAEVTLTAGDRAVAGIQQDAKGRFWQFVVSGLKADTLYDLRLWSDEQPLCDPWPLRTFPAREARLEQLNLVAYTCAGGPDLPVLPGGRHAFKPASYRRQLYRLMLEQQPDLVISNGDHIYWDYESWANGPDSALGKFAVQLFLDTYGKFDDQRSVKDPLNESSLIAIGDEQIASTYGVVFRSTPVFFVTDDHDYFDNDDASPERVSFPPNRFHRQLRDRLQDLYFPEFIWDEPDVSVPGLLTINEVSLSRQFGACRVGKLFDAVIFDCGGELSLDGEQARLVPESVEQWLLNRTASETTQHFVQIPSHPMGWTAGKWREWYPDQIDSDGSLLVPVEADETGGKYMWQSGWWHQHQRLLHALTSQIRRRAISLSGDLHLLGGGYIEASAELDCRDNPVMSILAGPVGVGDIGWLSTARGLTAKVPDQLQLSQWSPPQEHNGFTVFKFSDQTLQVQQYSAGSHWVEPEALQVTPLGELQTLEAFI